MLVVSPGIDLWLGPLGASPEPIPTPSEERQQEPRRHDGEEAIDWLVDDSLAGGNRDDILGRVAKRPGSEIPPLAPDPPDEPPPSLSLADRLAEFPCHSTILTPNTELSGMFLTEAARGCSRGCTYCVMRRSTNGGMRLIPPERVLAATRSIREEAYVVYAVGFTAVFVYLFSALGNFGILARQRSMTLPLLLVVIALPTARQRVRHRRVREAASRSPTRAWAGPRRQSTE